MKYMDRLPTVISCCFCCFLRAGTVMIAIFSFMAGLIFAPNIAHYKGFWDMDSVLSYYSSATEAIIQIILGGVSIMLCIVSCMLIIGSLCNMPILIEAYQWGACVHTVVVSLLFLILAFMCFFIHADCLQAGGLLCGIIICNVLMTLYFVIVANSLRMSLVYLATNDILSL